MVIQANSQDIFESFVTFSMTGEAIGGAVSWTARGDVGKAVSWTAGSVPWTVAQAGGATEGIIGVSRDVIDWTNNVLSPRAGEAVQNTILNPDVIPPTINDLSPAEIQALTHQIQATLNVIGDDNTDSRDERDRKETTKGGAGPGSSIYHAHALANSALSVATLVGRRRFIDEWVYYAKKILNATLPIMNGYITSNETNTPAARDTWKEIYTWHEKLQTAPNISPKTVITYVNAPPGYEQFKFFNWTSHLFGTKI